MLNPSWYAKPRMQHQNFEEKKKLICLHYKHNGTLWDTHDLWDVPKNSWKTIAIEFICKVRKTEHINKVRFFKKNLQKSTLTVMEVGVAMKLGKPSIFLINWVSPCLSFSEVPPLLLHILKLFASFNTIYAWGG